jgi:nitrite reductase/ring-hydroxylating ferredoxin subunit
MATTSSSTPAAASSAAVTFRQAVTPAAVSLDAVAGPAPLEFAPVVIFRQAVTHPAVSLDAVAGPAPLGFAPVAPLASIPQGLSGAPSFAGGPLVVARRDGTVIKALSLHCCHKEAELSLGDIEDAGGRFSVKCPRHRKKFPGGLNFDCETGAAWCAGKPEPNAWNDSWGKKGDVAVYETKEEGGWLWASVEPLVGINKKKARKNALLLAS